MATPTEKTKGGGTKAEAVVVTAMIGITAKKITSGIVTLDRAGENEVRYHSSRVLLQQVQI